MADLSQIAARPGNMFIAKQVSAETTRAAKPVAQPMAQATAPHNRLRGAAWTADDIAYLRASRAKHPPDSYRQIAAVLARDESACRIKACKIDASKPNHLRGKVRL